MEKISFEPNIFCQPCHDVICLTDNPSFCWEELQKKSSSLSRGWYELSLLSREDRIEFTHLFWLSKLFLSENFKIEIDHFFAGLSNIEILLVQQRKTLPYTPLMLYTDQQETTFFGAPPALAQLISRVAQQFSHLSLPQDYLSFFEIHDGFFSCYDLGIIPLRDLASYYHRFTERLTLKESDFTLFPFCELENVHQVHCFYKLPGSATIANLYVDQLDLQVKRKEMFESFIQWLLYYVHSRRSI